jgi:hypothetical protein
MVSNKGDAMAEWSTQSADDSINDDGILRVTINTLDGKAEIDIDLLEEGVVINQITSDVDRRFQPPVAGATKKDFEDHEHRVDVEVGKAYAASLSSRCGKKVSIKAAMTVVGRLESLLSTAKKNLPEPQSLPSGSDSTFGSSASLNQPE